MFLDDIFDGKGSDNKSNIFNPAELLQNSWSDGSHQQIFAPPNPSNLLPSVEFGSGSGNDRVHPTSFLSKIGLPDLPKLPGLPSPGDLPKLPGLPDLPKPPGLADLPKLPGLPSPGDLPKLPGLPDLPQPPRLVDLPKLPGLPNPGDLPLVGQLPQLPIIGDLPQPPGLPDLPNLPIPNFGDLPQPPSLTDLPRPPIPNPSDRQFPFPNLADIVGSSTPFAGEFVRTALENFQTNQDQTHRRHHGPHNPRWQPEHGGPVIWPRNPNFGRGHCPDNSGGEEPVEPIVRSPQPVDRSGPITGDREPFDPFPIEGRNPCPTDETGGQEQQRPHYDNVTSKEIKDVMDKHFEDIDGSNANSLQKLFGFDKNGHVDSKEIMDFVTKNMDKLSDREIRVLLTASQKEQEISNAYNDEWGAETSGMSRSDISVWERQQPKNHIPEDEIVFRPYIREPWVDKRYPLPNSI